MPIGLPSTQPSGQAHRVVDPFDAFHQRLLGARSNLNYGFPAWNPRRHPRLVPCTSRAVFAVRDDGAVRVTRLLINGFRGWQRLDLRPDGHVLLAGVPRAGRTDIITALARVPDPHVGRNPSLSDLYQQPLVPGPGGSHASHTPPVGPRVWSLQKSR